MPRFLVLEDEPMIAAMLYDWLEQQGHVVEALAQSNSVALDLIDPACIDAAILDVQVSDGRAYPVASKLRQHGIPFLFATGWTIDAIEHDFRNELIARKPFEFEAFSQQLHELLGTPATPVTGSAQSTDCPASLT